MYCLVNYHLLVVTKLIVNFIVLCPKQNIFNCLQQSKKKPVMCGLLHHLLFKHYVNLKNIYQSNLTCDIKKFNKLWKIGKIYLGCNSKHGKQLIYVVVKMKEK